MVMLGAAFGVLIVTGMQLQQNPVDNLAVPQ